MEAHVIPFPTGAQRAAEGDLSTDPVFLLNPASVRPVAELRAELRRLPREGHGASLPIDRCLRAAIRALAGSQAELSLAGTDLHPMFGASFHGPGSRAAAARAAQVVAEAVRRSSDGRLVLAAGVAEGWDGSTIDGIHAIIGDPAEVAADLAERAAPGQVLLGGDGWTAMERVRTHPAHATLGDPVPVYVLRDVR